MLPLVKAKGLGNKERFEQAGKNFFINANAFHDSKYDYTLSIYNGYTKSFKYICPSHGEREQTPVIHLKSIGCAKCAKEKAAQEKQEKAATTFFQRMSKLHNNKYNYSNSIYTGVKNKFNYVCPIHGTRTQTAGDHLRGSGCSKCGGESQATRSFLKAQKKFFLKINQNQKLDYSESVYYGSLSPFTFVCPIHGKQTQLVGNHLTSRGCPACATHGFKLNEPAILYYLKHIESGYYKSGITNRTLKERFEGRYKEFGVIQITKFEIGADARKKELEILEEYQEHKIDFDSFAGNGATEFFNKDVLNLDT